MVLLMMRKEIVLFCLIGTFIVGFVYTHNVMSSLQIMYNAIMTSATELLGVAVVISLITAMSKGLAEIGADELMIRPLSKIVRSRTSAFFVIGFSMLIFSWFLWPSPAVALIGAMLLPVALKVGIPAIWAAVAMNIFGHGLGLSTDFFIQGAPSITAKAAGIPVQDLMAATVPIWAAFGVVTVTIAFYLFKKEMKNTPAVSIEAAGAAKEERKIGRLGQVMAVVTPLAFVIDIVLMLTFKIVGGDATALIGGTALVITVIITIFKGNFMQSLEDVSNYYREGFRFAMKIFAPVFVIAAFFYLGTDNVALAIMGEGFPSILKDFGLALANAAPLNRVSVSIVQSLIGILTGLDGSGFSTLPIMGSLADTLTIASNLSTTYLAALGQVVEVAVGGGTIIPWGVIPVAAICGVSPTDLARKNLIPVCCGFVAATIMAMFLL
jgi:TRAP-type C4-dicarboxylate transport system permease large subunit